ncbi:MAG TPA: penicillin acylase family protein [Acetobacteraceae bacterium]|nr:penicillin acylase family protein [Acetobacteraceae bacterium]
MRSLLRGIARLLSAIGVALLLIATLIGGALWFTLPRSHQLARIAGLSAPVDVTFDADGIPRIRAANEMDAAAALGFVHARDRMFEMDLMRRNASGRLSELAGPATLPLDRLMRTLGLRRAAEADYAALPADTRAILQAYANGVNAWIALRGRFAAPEFLLFGAPEPWSPVDSLLWAKTMGLWLSLNWRTELSRQALAGRVPRQLIDELWPDESGPGHPQASLSLPRQFADAAARLEQVLPRFPSPFTLPNSASNEWAVDGRHTATGAPLLAGDPHLAFGFPAIWYLARIDTPDLTLVGATAPGVPGLVLGHNGHIAWSFTTTGADTQDVFVETPVGTGEYQTPDGPRPFTVRQERIKVRGRPDEVLTVRSTRHGPVISDLLGRGGKSPSNGPVLAVSMASLAPGDTAAAGLFALNRARTVQQAGAAAAEITSPVQNLLVADRHTIALYVTGRVPIRRAGDGAAPVPGGDGAHDWIGWASGDQLPHYVSPASGRLVNTNERIAPPDFPVFLGGDWFGDWRARRIRQLLDAPGCCTVAGFARMQTDVVSSFAQQVLPVLLAVPPQPGHAGNAQTLLRGWDGAMTMDAPQPLIFNAWMMRFYALVLHKAGIPIADGGPLPDFVAFVLSPPGAHWCGGDCNAALAEALKTAVDELSARFGPDQAAWRWGTAHPAVFAHPMLRAIPLLGALTTLSIASPGDDTTIDRGTPRFRDFTSVHGAAYRGVYDLADLDRSLFVIAPGQSGNPLSRLSRNFMTRWRDGATITIGPQPTSVIATIHLIP